MLVFTPGTESMIVSVTTVEDTTVEENERLYLKLTSATNAHLGADEKSKRGLGTILDNDSPPQINIDKLTTGYEGAPAVVNVRLSRPSQTPVIVLFATSDLPSPNAVGGQDYVITSGSITFQPNQTLATINIELIGDTTEEKPEQFQVTLSNPSYGSINQNPGRVKITEDFAEYLRDNPELAALLNPCECECECPTVKVHSIQDPISGENHVAAEVSRSKLDSFLRAIYLASGNPHPIVSYEGIFPIGQVLPNKIKAELTYGGIAATPVWFNTTGFAAGDRYRLAVQVDASTLPTGTHNYTLTLTEYTGGSSTSRTLNGRHALVNDINSPYGNRWMLEGLEQLSLSGSRVTYRSDRGVIYYAANGQGGYHTPNGYTATLVKNADTSYTLTDVDGSRREFDPTGLLTKYVDRTGNATTYAYTGGLLTSITDALGGVMTLAYSSGRLSTITDFEGLVTSYVYDGSGRLTSITRPDPDGAGPLAAPVMAFSYDPTTNLLTSSTDSGDKVTRYQYDFAGRIDRVIHPSGAVEEIDALETVGLVNPASGLGSEASPAPLARLADVVGKYRDPLGNQSVVRGGHFGAITSVTDDHGITRDYERDAEGRIVRVTQPQGDGADPAQHAVTTIAYDARGNVTSITHPDGGIETFQYDATFSQLTQHTDPLGHVTLYDIDPANGNVRSVTRVIGQTDPAGGETNDLKTILTYTPNPTGAGQLPGGLLLSITDPKGLLSTLEYGTTAGSASFGRLTRINYAVGTPAAASQQFEYSTSGRLSASIDELGRRTEFTYDKLGRWTQTTLADPDGGGPLTSPVYQFTFDSMGRLLVSIDPLGRVTGLDYDDRSKVAQVTLPDPDAPARWPARWSRRSATRAASRAPRSTPWAA